MNRAIPNDFLKCMYVNSTEWSKRPHIPQLGVQLYKGVRGHAPVPEQFLLYGSGCEWSVIQPASPEVMWFTQVFIDAPEHT